MQTMDLIATACPKIGALGSAFYFDKATLAKGKELGLDGFRFYILGRGGVLGDVEPDVIRSAFGYFAPATINKVWGSAREIMAPRDAGRAYVACSQEFGRRVFADVEGLEELCAAAKTVNDATDAASLALYAGLAAEPLCDDVPGQAMQLIATLREYRGSAHLAAIRVLGLDPAAAHAIKRPDDVATFGYTEPPTITDEDRAKHVEAEKLTDQMVAGAYSTLDDAGANALVAGLEGMEAAVAG